MGMETKGTAHLALLGVPGEQQAAQLAALELQVELVLVARQVRAAVDGRALGGAVHRDDLHLA